MADRIDEIRAREIAAREGYPVHVGCGGEVRATPGLWWCHGCGRYVPLDEHVGPDRESRDYAEDVTHLLALVDELRERAEKAEAVLVYWTTSRALPYQAASSVDEMAGDVRAALSGEDSKR